jgi:hypothetical protein
MGNFNNGRIIFSIIRKKKLEEFVYNIKEFFWSWKGLGRIFHQLK